MGLHAYFSAVSRIVRVAFRVWEGEKIGWNCSSIVTLKFVAYVVPTRAQFCFVTVL